MKSTYYIYILFCLLFFASSCKKEELQGFNASPQIYFYDADRFSATVKDSTLISFARLDPTIKETIIELPLAYVGQVSDVDRDFLVTVDKDNSTAVEGKHYVLLPDTYRVLKGATKATLPIKLISGPELDNNVVHVVLKIQKNKNFDTRIDYMNTDHNKIDLSRYKVLVSNMLLKPSWWDSSTELYLGEFSRKKVDLIDQVTKKNLDDLEKARTTFNWDLFAAVAKETQIYINYMRATSHELKDENNKAIDMGTKVK